MISRWTRVMGMGTLLAALALGAAGCDDDNSVFNPPTGGGGSSSNLTVTNATPADGNATLTVTGTFTANAGGTGFDELNLSEVVGATGHDVTLTWDTNTHALHGAGHGWGTGWTQCVMGTGFPCDPATVVIDVAGHQVTFTNMILVDDTFSTTATCTLNGTARW